MRIHGYSDRLLMKPNLPDEKHSRTIYFPESGIHLHAMLTGCGTEIRRNPAQYDLSSHFQGKYSYCIWQYTLEGEGEVTVRGNTSRLFPGDAMLLFSPDDYRYRLPEHSPVWKFIFLSFNGSESLRICGDLVERYGHVLRMSTEQSKSIDLAHHICSIANSGQLYSPLQASGLTYSFLMALCGDLEQNSFAERESGFILDAVRFCTNHFSENISVEDIASFAGYSRCHFSRLFKEHHGISPGVFLRNLRLGNAARILQQEICTIREVAERCGFSDESYFCRLFHSYYGITPEQFRRRNRTCSEIKRKSNFGKG